MEQLIVGTDATFYQLRAALLEVIDNLQKSGLAARISQALEESKLLNENNMALRKHLDNFAKELKGQIESMSTDSAAQVSAVKADAPDWATKFKDNIVSLFQAGIGHSGGKGQRKRSRRQKPQC